jgi:hypothetical protein
MTRSKQGAFVAVPCYARIFTDFLISATPQSAGWAI